MTDPVAAPETPRTWPRWLHGLLLALFALGVVLATGYGFGSEDSASYVPLALNQLHPDAFRGDDVFGWILSSPWNYHTSFFSGLMAFFAHGLGMEWSFFLLHLLVVLLLVASWWGIGYALGGATTGYLTLFALVAARPVGGTAFLTWPHELQPRTLATALAFAAIALAANRYRPRLNALITCLATLCHPISGLMAIPTTFFAPLMGDVSIFRRLRETFWAIGLLVVPYLLWTHLNTDGFPVDTTILTRMSASWQQLIDYRLQGQALNVSSWSAFSWLAIAVPFGLWALGVSRRAPLQRADRVLGAAVLAAVLLASAGSIGADVFRSVLCTQLMLSRLLFVPLVVGTAYGVWWFSRRFREGGWLDQAWALVGIAAFALGQLGVVAIAALALALLERAALDSWLAFGSWVLTCGWLLLLVAIGCSHVVPAHVGMAAPSLMIFGEPPLINVLVVAAASAVMIAAGRMINRERATITLLAALSPVLVSLLIHRGTPPLVQLQRLAAGVQSPWNQTNTDFAKVAYWARAHTPEGTRFLTPVEAQGFRAMAERPQVMDGQDGGIVMFSPKLASDWMARYQELKSYETKSTPEISALAHKYDCAYVVLPREHAMPGPVAFEAGRYVLQAISAAEAPAAIAPSPVREERALVPPRPTIRWVPETPEPVDSEAPAIAPLHKLAPTPTSAPTAAPTSAPSEAPEAAPSAEDTTPPSDAPIL